VTSGGGYGGSKTIQIYVNNLYLILGSILGPDNWEEGSVDVGVEEYIGSAVGAGEAELCDEGDVRQDLGISRGVRSGLHFRVLAFRGS